MSWPNLPQLPLRSPLTAHGPPLLPALQPIAVGKLAVTITSAPEVRWQLSSGVVAGIQL